MTLELITDAGRKATIEGPSLTGWWHWSAAAMLRIEVGSQQTKRGAMQAARNALANYMRPGDSSTGKWKETK